MGWPGSAPAGRAAPRASSGAPRCSAPAPDRGREQAQRHVQLAFLDQLVLGTRALLVDLQVHTRIALLEQRDHRRHVMARGGHDAQGQLAARDVIHLGHLPAQQLGLLQNLQSAVIDHLAGIGELHAPPLAQQQTATEFIFQRLDHLADGGLGHMQGFGRAGEAVLAHHLNEIAQGAQVHDNSFYAWKK
jgi:hypothetical protein